MLSECQYDDYGQMSDIYYQEELDEREYRRLRGCILTAIGVLLFSGLIYAATGEKIYAAVPFLLTILVLCFFHTVFAFCVLFFVPIIEEWYPILPGLLALSKIIGVIIVLSFLLHSNKRRIEISKPLKWMLFFGAWILLSVLWSPLKIYCFIAALTPVLYICLTVILVTVVKDFKSYNVLIGSLFAGDVFVAVIMATGRGIHATAGKSLTAKGGVTASSYNVGRAAFAEGGLDPNTIGIILALGFLIGMYYFIKSGLFIKIVFGAINLLLLYVIITTESRSALVVVSFASISAFFLAAKKGFRAQAAVLVVVMALTAMMVLWVMMNTDIVSARAKDRMRGTLKDTTFTGRTGIWRRGGELLLQRPFHGWGWSAFPLMVTDTTGGRSAHSDMVMIATELGLIGFSVAAFVYFLLLKKSRMIDDYRIRFLNVSCLTWLFFGGLSLTLIYTRVFWYALALVILSESIISRNALYLERWYSHEMEWYNGEEDGEYYDDPISLDC